MTVSQCCPWRSVWFARVVAVVALVIGIPLFLRTPPWCDITLYQMAARNILNGGTHYQDIFDTNLPGFVWVLTVLQWLFGESVVAVRATDLLIVSGTVFLIDRLAKWGGASLASRWWALAGAALFYPFTVEMSHAQRDTWMTLPALAAVTLRVRRGMGGTVSPPFRASLLEGLLWGAGVWIKPHIVIMAAAVWLLTARRIAGEFPRPWRAAGTDFLGNVLGGGVVGLAGLTWLLATGTWKPFLEVFTQWNPGYLQLVKAEVGMRMEQELHWFPPWSLGLIPTVPLALVSVLDMAPWASRSAANARPDRAGVAGRRLPALLWDKQAHADARFARGVLGGLYLAWTAQAFFLQRGFQYAHVPETFLMLGVWASHRWAWTLLVLLWLAVTTSMWFLAEQSATVWEQINNIPTNEREHYVPRHPIFTPERLRLWPQCWRPDLDAAERYRMWDRLRLHPPHEAVISWEEINEVVTFLRAQGVSDGEVIAWFDSPHAAYLLLNQKPGLRFMHVYTAISIGFDENGEDGRVKVMRELATKTPKARFVINDLEWGALPAKTEEQRAPFLGPARHPPDDLLPLVTPDPTEFPFNQPTVFRTRNNQGRYIVHKLVTRENSLRTIGFIETGAETVIRGAQRSAVRSAVRDVILPK
ncbi:Uncharacterized protein OS=Planctomyces maris DSM 8797 GN=PM8797T_32020 PE=4 SV=1 [Gemmata massiliana]|uniref:Glycosyltransferase RgtA/B/C/D-like domain-containing protein n=1 Tax=Gemmata massiliana TaxID=1210884 RepID=A0A6P2DJ93_9BACT|nr:hypothetical protein [Gemmata massiliana]VTS02267.1 Uncharacterized protein OS=Planctomyces maris DSM 8797 GN=PM8797T_32020 PE=4 SV=1 [Gemmata massiliana]